jgi:anthrone oxygenase-like protein
MKVSIAFLSIFMASGLTMVTLYNTLVDAKSWGSDIPASIQTARDYYAHADPRRFYLIAGPPTVLLGVLTTILFWRDAVSLRLLFGASAACYVAIVVLTISYFVPRDLMLFRGPIQERLDAIRAAVGQWSRMNWARTLLGCGGVLCSMRALDLYYIILTERLSGR